MTSRPTQDPALSLKSAGLLFGSQEIISRVASIGLSLLAARSLGPGEVGRLGLAVIISALVSMVASCAETAAVILDRSYGTSGPAREAARMRFWLTAVLVAPLVIWTRPLLTLLGAVEDSGLVWMVRLMLLVPCLEALASRPSVLAQRTLDLSYLGRIQLGGVVGYVTMSLAALAAGFGIAGMIGAQILSTTGTTVVLWTSARTRWTQEDMSNQSVIRPELRRGAWRLFVGGFGGFLAGRFDSLLVARSLGPLGLGLYSTAWSASRLCSLVFARAMNSVLGPLIPQVGVASERAIQVLRRTYVHFTLAAGAVSSVLMAWSPLLVPPLLGERWRAAIPVLQLTAVSALCAPIVNTAGLLLSSTGRAHLIALGTAAHLGAVACLIPPLASAAGVAGAALGDIGAVAVLTAVLVGVLKANGLPVQWIDRRVTLWGLVGVVPSALVGVSIDPSTMGWGGAAGLASLSSLVFLCWVSLYGPYREILIGIAKGGRAIHSP